MAENEVAFDGIMSAKQLVDFALTYWSLQKYTNKMIEDNDLESKSRPVKSYLNKMKSILQTFGIEIIDYDSQKFNEGMNVDVIDTIKSDIAIDIIKETIEPSIIFNGQMIKRAKVIKEINGGKNE